MIFHVVEECGHKLKLSFVLSQITRLTDRQMDRTQKETFLVTRPPCIQCSAVITLNIAIPICGLGKRGVLEKC